MNILFILIPLHIILVAAAVAAFVWSVARGQYDDLDTPAQQILWDDK